MSKKWEIRHTILETDAIHVFTVEPSICPEYGNVPEVVSRCNPIFLYSSGEAVSSDCEGHVEKRRLAEVHVATVKPRRTAEYGNTS